MLQLLLVVTFSLALANRADGSLDLLPVLRNGRISTLGHHREVREKKSTRDAVDSLPREITPSRNGDDANGDIGLLLNSYAHASNNYFNNRQTEDAVHNLIHDLLVEFAQYELNKQRQKLQTREAQSSSTPSKRLWGQRRNVQTRFATFGSKLTPNRKLPLGGVGSNLLRYGRSAGGK